jgi:hypothetical protein
MEQRGRHGLTRIFSTRPLQPPPPPLALAPLRFRAPALLSIVCAVHLICHQSPAAATTSYSSHSRQPAPPRWSSASASTRTSLPPPRSLCLPHRSRCFPAFGQVGISYSSIAASAHTARIPAAPCSRARHMFCSQLLCEASFGLFNYRVAQVGATTALLLFGGATRGGNGFRISSLPKREARRCGASASRSRCSRVRAMRVFLTCMRLLLM